MFSSQKPSEAGTITVIYSDGTEGDSSKVTAGKKPREEVKQSHMATLVPVQTHCEQEAEHEASIAQG